MARDGKYKFTLSGIRFTGYAHEYWRQEIQTGSVIEKVRISIAGKTREKAVKPEDTPGVLRSELEGGNSDLETALLGDGIDRIAYFVTAEYLGE